MFRGLFAEKFGHYPYQVDLVAVCTNPNSTRTKVGYTYLRNEKGQISLDSLQRAIDNGRKALKYCPQDCTIATCQLRALANATPEELQAIFSQGKPLLEG